MLPPLRAPSAGRHTPDISGTNRLGSSSRPLVDSNLDLPPLRRPTSGADKQDETTNQPNDIFWGTTRRSSLVTGEISSGEPKPNTPGTSNLNVDAGALGLLRATTYFTAEHKAEDEDLVPGLGWEDEHGQVLTTTSSLTAFPTDLSTPPLAPSLLAPLPTNHPLETNLSAPIITVTREDDSVHPVSSMLTTSTQNSYRNDRSYSTFNDRRGSYAGSDDGGGEVEIIPMVRSPAGHSGVSRYGWQGSSDNGIGRRRRRGRSRVDSLGDDDDDDDLTRYDRDGDDDDDDDDMDDEEEDEEGEEIVGNKVKRKALRRDTNDILAEVLKGTHSIASILQPSISQTSSQQQPQVESTSDNSNNTNNNSTNTTDTNGSINDINSSGNSNSNNDSIDNTKVMRRLSMTSVLGLGLSSPPLPLSSAMSMTEVDQTDPTTPSSIHLSSQARGSLQKANNPLLETSSSNISTSSPSTSSPSTSDTTAPTPANTTYTNTTTNATTSSISSSSSTGDQTTATTIPINDTARSSNITASNIHTSPATTASGVVPTTTAMNGMLSVAARRAAERASRYVHCFALLAI